MKDMAAGIVMNDFSGTTEVSVPGLLMEHRKLMLTGEITSEVAADFVSKMICLGLENSMEEIDVYIDSPGGSIDAGMMIVDVIRNANVPVNLYVIGEAASMAAVILASGRKGNRYILPHARTMIHQPLIHGHISKNTSSVVEIADHLVKTKDMIYQILSETTGNDIEEIEKVTVQGEHIMDATESVKFGLCDRIIESIV